VDLLEQMMSEMTKTGVRPIFFWRKAIYKFFSLKENLGSSHEKIQCIWNQ